jgi:hypothetical protein
VGPEVAKPCGWPAFPTRQKQLRVAKPATVERHHRAVSEGAHLRDQGVGYDVELGKVVEEGEEIDVEDEDPLVERAPLDRWEEPPKARAELGGARSKNLRDGDVPPEQHP